MSNPREKFIEAYEVDPRQPVTRVDRFWSSADMPAPKCHGWAHVWMNHERGTPCQCGKRHVGDNL